MRIPNIRLANRARPWLHSAKWTLAGSKNRFPAHDYLSYREAARFGRTPLAAGENHYTRFEFDRVIEDGAITILQPDLSKTGRVTEALRIAPMASAWKLPIHPPRPMTGLNHAPTSHFLPPIPNSRH